MEDLEIYLQQFQYITKEQKKIDIILGYYLKDGKVEHYKGNSVEQFIKELPKDKKVTVHRKTPPEDTMIGAYIRKPFSTEPIKEEYYNQIKAALEEKPYKTTAIIELNERRNKSDLDIYLLQFPWTNEERKKAHIILGYYIKDGEVEHYRGRSVDEFIEKVPKKYNVTVHNELPPKDTMMGAYLKDLLYTEPIKKESYQQIKTYFEKKELYKATTIIILKKKRCIS